MNNMSRSLNIDEEIDKNKRKKKNTKCYFCGAVYKIDKTGRSICDCNKNIETR